ncbi:MAG: hypothetical protein KIS68_13480 [Bauldia sp.]|nr:hypothetical protein [Bauldia sp.]
MLRLSVGLAACAFTILPWAASAQTLTLATEGGLGFRLTAMVSPIGIGRRIDIPDPQPEHIDIAARSPLVGRSEVILALPTGAHGFIEVGAIAAGWIDAEAATHESIGMVVCKPYYDPDQKPECEIKVCDDLEFCSVFESLTVAYYREVMGVVAAGWRLPGGATLSIGARPFIGQFTERFVTTGSQQTMNWADGLDARFIGVLGVSELDIPLGERTHLLLSAGAGGYRFAGETVLFDLDLAGQGIRAQFGSGISVDIGQRVALGLMGRIDYWSAWPGVTTPISDPFTCAVNQNNDPVCEPPKVTGTFGAAVAPAWNASVALRLAVQFGN